MIEPDQSCRRTLEELRALHERPGLNWIIDACAVGWSDLSERARSEFVLRFDLMPANAG